MEENNQSKPTQQKNKIQMLRIFLSQKKVLIVIGIIVIVIIAFFAFLLAFSKPKNAANTYQIPTLPGSILFSPSNINVLPGQNGTANILIDPGGNPVNGLELAISYDPKLISNIYLTPFKDPHSAFIYGLSQIGNNQVYKDGIIMTLKLPYNVPPQKDGGKVAVLNFAVNKNASSSDSTKMTILSVSNFFVPEGAARISTSRNQLEINFSQPFTK